MLNSLAKKSNQNALRKTAKIYWLNDFRPHCLKCEGLRLMDLVIIATDKNGTFSVPSLRCVSCEYHWPKQGFEEVFDRFLRGDI